MWFGFTVWEVVSMSLGLFLIILGVVYKLLCGNPLKKLAKSLGFTYAVERKGMGLLRQMTDFTGGNHVTEARTITGTYRGMAVKIRWYTLSTQFAERFLGIQWLDFTDFIITTKPTTQKTVVGYSSFVEKEGKELEQPDAGLAPEFKVATNQQQKALKVLDDPQQLNKLFEHISMPHRLEHRGLWQKNQGITIQNNELKLTVAGVRLFDQERVIPVLDMLTSIAKKVG
ncbi:hypothetical protein ACFLQ2_02730 [archaeon]